MKVLFICSQKFDYGQDLMYSGLCEYHGQESIFAEPRNWGFYLPFRKYPKNLGYVGPAPLFNNKSLPPEEADLVIVGACKPDAFEHYLKIQKRIPKDTPVFLLDGGDREEIGGDLKRLGGEGLFRKAEFVRAFDLIFKREYLKNKSYPERIKPLPFSMNLKALGVEPQAKKNKDVCFWAMESHPIRKKAFELLKGQFDCDRNGTGKSKSLKAYRYKGKRYHQELAKAKIAISLRGGGWDTLRYWEIPAMGTLLMSTPLDIVIPNDFEDKKHIVRCRPDLSDMIDLCHYYLKHEDERQRIAAAGFDHLLVHHTNEARAEYLLSFVDFKEA